MKSILLITSFLLAAQLHAGEGYKVGDKAASFKLKNTDGKMIGFSDFPDAKGFVVVFTCNNCPYAKAYQDRLIEIDKHYKTKGYPVIAVNPNDLPLNLPILTRQWLPGHGKKAILFRICTTKNRK